MKNKRHDDGLLKWSNIASYLVQAALLALLFGGWHFYTSMKEMQIDYQYVKKDLEKMKLDINDIKIGISALTASYQEKWMILEKWRREKNLN